MPTGRWIIRLWTVSIDFLLRLPFKIRFKEKAINVILIRDISKDMNKE
jgi:hypothetical protein